MQRFVKIKLIDREKVLEHFFVREQKWRLPSGTVENGETSQRAAYRELLERTGYEVPEEKLKETGIDEEGSITFEVSFSDAKKVAEAGERGGYSTSIRWVNKENYL